MNTTLKSLLIALLFLALPVLSQAQTFYELQFTVPDDESYIGLLIYKDETHVKMRLISDESLKNNQYYEANYTAVVDDKTDDNDVGVMTYVPDDKDLPYLIWSWTKSDLSDIEEEPMVAFDPDDPSDWIKATAFEEIPLKNLDEKYVSQFYNPDEPEYKQLLAGAETMNEQDVREQIVGSADGTLHLIAAANTNVSDIGQACKVDLSHVENEFRGIAKAVGLGYDQQVVAGDNYGKQQLADVIDNLEPGSNDVVVFVYSGHGFRFQDQKDYYPNMDMSSTSYDKATENYIPFSDVYKAISEKGARLNIVLSDCCNNTVNANRPVVNTNSLYSRSNNSFDKNKLRKLFLRSKGDLVATAASPGQFSWCGANGGFFLMSFIESLRDGVSVLSKDQPSWDDIVKDAIANAAKKSSSTAGTAPQNGIKYVQVKGI